MNDDNDDDDDDDDDGNDNDDVFDDTEDAAVDYDFFPGMLLILLISRIFASILIL